MSKRNGAASAEERRAKLPRKKSSSFSSFDTCDFLNNVDEKPSIQEFGDALFLTVKVRMIGFPPAFGEWMQATLSVKTRISKKKEQACIFQIDLVKERLKVLIEDLLKDTSQNTQSFSLYIENPDFSLYCTPEKFCTYKFSILSMERFNSEWQLAVPERKQFGFDSYVISKNCHGWSEITCFDGLLCPLETKVEEGQKLLTFRKLLFCFFTTHEAEKAARLFDSLEFRSMFGNVPFKQEKQYLKSIMLVFLVFRRSTSSFFILKVPQDVFYEKILSNPAFKIELHETEAKLVQNESGEKIPADLFNSMNFEPISIFEELCPFYGKFVIN